MSKRTIIILVFLVFVLGCYGLPEKHAAITGSASTPGCEKVAVSVTELYTWHSWRIPDMSGWSQRGTDVLPVFSWQKAVIYWYEPARKSVKKVFEIWPPGGFKDRFSVRLDWWDNNGLYSVVSGCTPQKGKRDCYPPNYAYKKLKNDGRIVDIITIPAPPKEISDSYKICTVYLRGNEVTIGPNGGPWTPILRLNDKGDLEVLTQ